MTSFVKREGHLFIKVLNPCQIKEKEILANVLVCRKCTKPQLVTDLEQVI